MSTYIEKSSKIEKYLFWGILVPTIVLLFVVLSQPAWNSKKLIQQQTQDCKKVGGVQIIDHGLFGDTYSCEARLGK